MCVTIVVVGRRCFLTLTQALALGYGGNPYGPAGTGKTESVKALGQALGRQVRSQLHPLKRSSRHKGVMHIAPAVMTMQCVTRALHMTHCSIF
jgi:MoxR-like ATPase